MQPIGTAAGLALMAMGFPQHGERWENDLEVVKYDDGKGKIALFWPTVVCPDPVTALDWLEETHGYQWRRDRRGWYALTPRLELEVSHRMHGPDHLIMAIHQHWKEKHSGQGDQASAS